MSVAYEQSAPTSVLQRRRMPRMLVGRIGARIAAGYLILIVFVAVAAPLLAPHNPNTINPLQSFAGPRWGYFLGQDDAGRDIFSRLIYGARLSLLGPAAIVAVSVILGVPAGVLAAWRGGIVDGVLSRITDAVLAFPPLLLAIVIAATFGAGFRTAIIAISVTYVPLLMRVARGLVLVEREKPYVDALRIQGLRTTRIIWLHVVPNVRRGITAQATLNFGYSLIDLAGLAFLGLGVQPPTADWGAMLSEGRQWLLINPTEVVSAAVLIAITVVAFNVVGDALASSAQGRR